MKTSITALMVFFFTALLASSAWGQFTAGNLVVLRVGDGTVALSSSAAAIFLHEYSISGLSIQTISITSSGLGRVTSAGSSISEGQIARSVDGRFLTFAGYDADAGTTTPASSSASTVNRIIVRIEASGTIDASTKLTDAYNGSNIRNAISTDGTAFYTCGNGGSGQGSSAGTRYINSLGATTSIGLHSSVTNGRVVGIFNGQLYYSCASGSNFGVNSVGTGIPTTAGQTVTLLSGFPTTAGSPSVSSYGFIMNPDGNTIYVADDRAPASSGGLQKWIFSSGTWFLAYTLNSGLSSGLRALAVDWSSTNPTIYATDGSNPSKLVTTKDSGSTSTFTTLVTAGTNTAFRGVTFAPNASITFTDGSSYVPPVATPGTNDNPIGRFKLVGNIAGGALKSVVINMNGTHSGITTLKLYYSTSTTFTVSGSSLLAITSDGATATFTFSGQSIPNGSGGYFYITADLDGAATGLVSVSIADQSKLSFSNASIIGTFGSAALSSSNILLPIQLSFFNAIGTPNGATLTWKTATETNCYGFEVERRIVNNEQSTVNNWSKVGFVQGSGTSNSVREYSYSDIKVVSDHYIYRLKQIDQDGSFRYFGNAEVEVGLAPNRLVLNNYPNPFNPSTEMIFSIPEDGDATLKVFNSLGQEVATLFDGAAKSGHFIQVTFIASRITSGVYFSRLQFNNRAIVRRMLFIK